MKYVYQLVATFECPLTGNGYETRYSNTCFTSKEKAEARIETMKGMIKKLFKTDDIDTTVDIKPLEIVE